MSRKSRFIAVMGACVPIATLSWLTVFSDVPTIYAPFNLPVFLAQLIGGRFFSIVIVLVLFCTWSWPVLRRSEMPPIRSIALFGLSLLGSTAILSYGTDVAIEYHGRNYLFGVAAISVSCWSLVGWLAYCAYSKPSFGRNYIFHIALFAWLA